MASQHNFSRPLLNATIPDKRVGTRSKFSPPPIFNVDNQVIFSLVGKNAIFSNIDQGGRGICDTAQVSQLLLAGIVTEHPSVCKSGPDRDRLTWSVPKKR